ncbi:HAD-IA family hydrolase [Slackia piriformis]|uniref:HAD-IA family hydrolase n=1 Tax=Slackia piriformis TaxID=626934 RepID=UPI002943BC50|nr:HAD-IA family hydrolase [Slackia piriformis]
MPILDTVLFDNDGTLVDTYDLILESFHHAVRNVLGHDIADEKLMAKVGQPLSTQMWDFTDDPAVHEELLLTYREFNHRIHDERVSLFPGVREGLERLREEGLKMGVVTSKMSPLARRGLEVLEVAEFFDCLVGADSCSKHKPDPDPILMGCDLLGATPESCVYVGDSPYDLQASNAAGTLSVAALWGMFDEDALCAENPCLACSDFSGLVDGILALREGCR